MVPAATPTTTTAATTAAIRPAITCDCRRETFSHPGREPPRAISTSPACPSPTSTQTTIRTSSIVWRCPAGAGCMNALRTPARCSSSASTTALPTAADQRGGEAGETIRNQREERDQPDRCREDAATRDGQREREHDHRESGGSDRAGDQRSRPGGDEQQQRQTERDELPDRVGVVERVAQSRGRVEPRGGVGRERSRHEPREHREQRHQPDGARQP